MGNTQNEILAELRSAISSLREQIDIIENKIAQLEAVDNFFQQEEQPETAPVLAPAIEPEIETTQQADVESPVENPVSEPGSEALALEDIPEEAIDQAIDELVAQQIEQPVEDLTEEELVSEEPADEVPALDLPVVEEESPVMVSDVEPEAEPELAQEVEPEIAPEISETAEEPVQDIPVDDSFPFDNPEPEVIQEQPAAEDLPTETDEVPVDLPASEDIDIAPVDFESLDVSIPDTDMVSIDIPEDIVAIDPADMVAAEPVDMIDVAAIDDMPSDTPIEEAEPAAEPVAEDTTVEQPVAEPVVEPQMSEPEIIEAVPAAVPAEEPEPIVVGPLIAEEEPSILKADTNTPSQPTSINDVAAEKPAKAVIDIFSEKLRWKTDMPGTTVKNIVSAISLNDRALFINTLFHEDPVEFMNTIATLNSMANLDEALAYLGENYSSWNMKSDVVYRFMMAVRRKLK